VVSTGDRQEPFHVLDVDGTVDESARRFVRHLAACDYSPATSRSYLLSLLQWLRFLTAVGADWNRAERHGAFRSVDARCRQSAATSQQRGPGRVGELGDRETGKPTLSEPMRRRFPCLSFPPRESPTATGDSRSVSLD